MDLTGDFIDHQNLLVFHIPIAPIEIKSVSVECKLFYPLVDSGAIVKRI
jgi:hypothetical protein